MKNILTIISILFCCNLFAQNKIGDLIINANQSKEKQYIGISSNGKKLLSNKKLSPTEWVNKGTFKGWELTQFADALKEYLNISQEISDSLSNISSGGFFTSSTATDDTEQDCNGHGFSIINVNSFNVSNTPGTSSISFEDGQNMIFGSADSTYSLDPLPKIDIDGSSAYYITADAGGHVHALPITGGGGDPGYYEAAFYMVCNGVNSCRLADTVLYNTFPCDIAVTVHNNIQNGFEIHLDGCGFTFTDHPQFAQFGNMQSIYGKDGSLIMLPMYGNGTDNIGVAPTVTSTGLQPVDFSPFANGVFPITLRYYHE